MAATGTVGSGKYTYEVDEDWAKLPEGWEMPAAAVYGDSKDRVYCFNRDPEPVSYTHLTLPTILLV